MRKYIISIIAAVFMAIPAFAQNVVKGVVKDNAGEVIPGVTVLDSDNSKWAITDLDGAFTLEGAAKGHTLQVSCLGYASQSIKYEGQAVLDIVLQSDTEELEETVVIGYGSVKKKDLTGAVGVVGSSVLEQQSTTQLSQSLQGAIPGLTVTRSSGMPGAGATLQIRGVTTIGDSSPLILVDGIVVNSIDNIASDDVEQITVLKDAAAASIYGARAAAGVILVTTKGAKEGDTHISYNGEYSMITATEWAEYLTDPINYMTMFNEYKWNDAGNGEGGDYQTYPKEYIDNYMANNAYDPITYPNFDWRGNMLKKFASAHKHNITVSYGNSVIKTRISGSFEDTDALYTGSDYKRIMARAKNNIRINKFLSMDVDVSFKHNVKYNTQTNPLKAAASYPSIYLGLYPDDRIAEGKSGSNTLAIIREGGYKSNANDLVMGRVALTLTPVEGLTITGSFSPSFTWTKEKDFNRAIPYYDAYDTALILGYVSNHTAGDNNLKETRNEAKSYEFQAVANYEHSFNNAHNLNVMAGYEDYYYFHENEAAESKGMELSDFPYLDLANKNNVQPEGNAYETAYRSVFARVMYNYKSRYYVQANVRTDGSSRFAKNYKWGVFPSVSLGWVISNERWMENVKPISYLKLRASLGTLGNERIGNYPYQQSISTNNAVMFGTGSNESWIGQMTAAQVAAAVNDITWESTWTYDIGLDASFFKNRLSLSADYYYKETKDMLLALEIPKFTGFGNPTVNAGTMYTNGWEAKIDWHDKVGDFNYAVGFNISDAKSIMGDLKGKVVIDNDAGTIIKEGWEYNSWYGFKSSGIFQNLEQVLDAPSQLISTVGPGDLGYYDLSGETGEPDGKISADYDRTNLGSSLPHYIFGGYINLGWKGLSLGIMFNGVGQQKALVTADMVRPFVSQWLSAPAVLLNKDGSRNYWSVYNTDEQNLKVKYPRLSYTSAEKNSYQLSDYWLMNGAYFRIRNINLAYSFPSKMIEKAKMKGLKLYFNIDDPICFDNYLKGWDPERTASSYIARTFTFGIDIKF